ncbi:cation:proton antiporter [uncultured Thermanaerothrix sp.]|uniref:cation:proton antiporter n=1 Tax=uncultured Thermanaerothrix sp. TaxID=1195149 RepID=UPI00260E777C|nr:cation:proton antiporter [uncultured Thermanaerothrix sp.]
MTPFLQFVLVAAIILFAAKVAGYVSTRLGQPSVLGELLIGLLLGPSLLDLIHLHIFTDVHLGEFVYEIGELGVLILMFLAGLELHIRDFVRNTRVSFFSGSLGVIVPVALGAGVGLLAQMPLDSALFLGLTLGATSVSISAQTLMELNVLRSRVGLGLLGAAVFDDILVILFLSIFLALGSGGLTPTTVLPVVLRMVLFLALSMGFGLWILPWLSRRVAVLPVSQAALSFAIVIMLVYGLAAEVVGGMAAITGTFLAGLMFARTPLKAQIENGLRALGYGFFIPIFFVNVGLAVDLHLIRVETIWVMVGVILVAIVGKILGAGLGARLSGYSWLEALQLGIGMVSRGEVGLIVATVGLDNGWLSREIFPAIVTMVLVTTLITPPLLRATFARKQEASKPTEVMTNPPEAPVETLESKS